MKIIILSLMLAICITVPVFSEDITREVKETYEDGSPAEIVYLLEGEEVFTESYDKEGNVSRRGAIPDGTVREYYVSGALKARTKYKDGKKNGKAREYHENGKVKAIITYVDSARNGITRVYREDGKLRARITYANGMKNGTTREYYDNGKVKNEWTYKDNVLEGVRKWFFSNGVIRWEEGYKAGEKIYKIKYSKQGKFISKKVYAEESSEENGD